MPEQLVLTPSCYRLSPRHRDAASVVIPTGCYRISRTIDRSGSQAPSSDLRHLNCQVKNVNQSGLLAAGSPLSVIGVSNDLRHGRGYSGLVLRKSKTSSVEGDVDAKEYGTGATPEDKIAKIIFPKVTFAKPKSTRNSSIEAFVVCDDYSPTEGFDEKDLYRLLEKVGSPSGAGYLDGSSAWLEGPNKVFIPFSAYEDLSGYDSDRSYSLPTAADGTYRILDPVQPPIAPPYKKAIELKKDALQGVQQIEKLS